MSTYICKCGRRVKKSTNADNTGNRLEGYGPGHECYGCPYAMPWGGNEWNETAKRFVQDIKGYECRMSRTLSYGSLFIGSTKDKCTCSVFSLDFDFLEQISTWVKDTFSQGELTGGFSRDEIRPTDYSHNGRYCCTFVCAANKKGISAKAALLARFFNPDGSRKDMTPQQEMEKVLADIRKATQAKEKLECTTMDSAAPSENAGTSFATGGVPLSNGTGSMTEPVHSAPQDKPLAFLPETTIPEFDYSGLPEQTVENLHFAEDEYHHGKQMAERGLVHMGNAIAAAHDELVAQCDKHSNQHSEDTFRAWCLSIGITKDSAYRLLQVSALMDGSSPRQRAILEALPPTLLYAVAKPSAPAELVEKVKNGEVSTNKEYQDLLKENQQLRTDRVNAMNQAEREKQRADAAEAREEEAWKLQSKSEAKAKDAETELEAVTADLNGLYDRAAQAEARNTALLDERAEYVQRIKELESRPIEVMHDPEETDRLAHQYAYGIAADMTEELRTKNNQQSQTIAALQKELEAARSTNGYDPQSDLETVCACIGSMEQMWGTALPAYERLTGKDLRTATDTLQDVIGRLYGDIARTAEDGED